MTGPRDPRTSPAVATSAGAPQGLPFRPLVLLVGLLAVLGMVGAIVLLGGSSDPVGPTAGGGGGTPSPSAGGGGGRPADQAPVTIANPAALAPPGGRAVPPTALPDAVMEWKTNRPWTAVLAHYYAAFPVDGMALDPKAMGRSSTRGVPTGETHNIIPQGAARAPGFRPTCR